ncbi:MAG: gliding motility protein GldN [Flavobacteriaceae bacterium]|nr:gliding motility protein GldN [Flavobacteriaceae bacterium]
MRKILLLLILMFAFSTIDAQRTKRRATPKTKRTHTKKSKKTNKVESQPTVELPSAPPIVEEKKQEKKEELKPIHSLNILNAESAEAFRYYRDKNLIKEGDSMVSIKRKPLKYGFIEDKDVLRSMVVWEIIDLNDKLNQPFYHNSNGLVSSSKSLYQILLDGVNDGTIKEVYDDELFTRKLSLEEIKRRTRFEVVSDAYVERINAGEQVSEEEKKQYVDVYETKTENVKMLKIKGMWYIDRRDGEMKYRLLGIAAMGKDPSTMALRGPNGEPLSEDNELIDLFWIFYPSARELLANSIVFNGKNLSSDISFDDVLNARRFSSIIYKSENGYGTGVIKDYIPNDADAQLEESERIREQILEMENDMWNY